MLNSTQTPNGPSGTHLQHGKYPKTPKPTATHSPLSEAAAQQNDHATVVRHVDSRQNSGGGQ